MPENHIEQYAYKYLTSRYPEKAIDPTKIVVDVNMEPIAYTEDEYPYVHINYANGGVREVEKSFNIEDFYQDVVEWVAAGCPEKIAG